MWLKSIFLLIFVQTVLVASQGLLTISCIYRQYSPQHPYTCDLTLINPNGFDSFETIQGDHLPGFTDADVRMVNGFNQNSVNVPSIICRQFSNVRDIYISSSNIQIINETAFADCRNLESIMLSFNQITDIPDYTFRNSENLNFIFMSNNQLRTLNPNSFAGTRGQYIALGSNFLTEINPQWFEPISETIDTLELLANDITSIPSRAFAGLPNLHYLDLTGNKFTDIPGDAFAGLTRLVTFYLSDTDIGQLDPNWFTDMRSLDELHVEYNQIAEIPDGVFTPLVRLRRVFLGSNNITTISAAPFGRNVAQIEVIALDNNPFISMDREFFVGARHLEVLSLYNGNCHDSNIYNIQANRMEAMRVLEKCFSNFGPEIATCQFGPNEQHDYICELSIRNPLGGDFPSLDGEHLADRSDDDVETVAAMFQSTRQIPQVFCRQFSQLRNIVLVSSHVEILNQLSISNCQNLEHLDLSYNEIRAIEDNTFINNPNLRELFLGRNRITRLSAESFAGTVIQSLDLSYNRLVEFDPEWDRPIENTLQNLELLSNNIYNIRADTFANLRQLRTLVLNGNFFSLIDADAFANLESLESLEMAGCAISHLNPQWFRSLSNLRHLSVGENWLTELPENIFNSMPNLRDIFLFGNRLTGLHASSFGASLPSITLLYASSNLINVIDPEIVNGGTELSSLLLYANICTQVNLFDVREDRNEALQRIQACTSQFELEPTVRCTYDRMITGRIYWCQLTAINPLGLEFERIEGNHIPGGSDDSVMYVEAEGQNTLNVPSVICHQFSSLEVLDLVNSGIHDITERSFETCGFLRELLIINNRFRQVPARAFAGARNLIRLFMMSNGIQIISPTAFAGTLIQTLDLSHNEIGQFNPQTYSVIGDTLRVLTLTDNRLEQLPPNAFDDLFNLVELELNGNHFFTLPSNLFSQPVNLEVLQISNCGLERIQPQLFSNLTRLRDLELALNDIDLLPENVFDLPNLETVGLDGNNLRILDSSSFGRALGTILSIDASLNRINAFDPALIAETSNLRSLNLAYNLCVDLSFGNIPQFREEVLRNLETCVSTFNDVQISCVFTEDEAQYECGLTLNNPNDRLTFTEIAGEHMEGHSDGFVTHVRALDQNSRGIPSIICQQFFNIEAFYFLASHVEYITSNNFAGCQNLYSINLSGNRLLEIPDGVFIANPYLSALTFASNRLNRLTPRIFEGTQVYYLDIENNQFQNFDNHWLTPIANNLRYLIIRNNQIRRFPPGAFSPFANLAILELSGNRDAFVPSNAFEGLTRLLDLEMANCALHDLNTHWFRDLQFLDRLEVDMNGIIELPTGIFDLPYLRFLGIAFNRIRVLDSSAFGSSVSSLFSIDAEENEITAIDRSIIENATGLSALLLTGNSCADANFLNVQDTRDEVLENLQGCFNNFESLLKSK